MKKIFLLLAVVLFLFACNDKKHNTPPKEILGGWKMEYYVYEGEKYIPQSEYKVVFAGDWFVKQFPDFVERGVPFSLNGKTLQWKANSKMGTDIDFKYNYSFKEDTLVLENLVETNPYIRGTSYYTEE